MNPLTNVKNLQKLNERELELGIIGKKSWHDEYKDSAWIFIGGLPYDLSEGDVICVFSQYGEVVNVNLIRDHKTGKSKGFAFLCFEDQRSTVLSVDNLNGIKIVGRTIRVDHVKDYKIPKEHSDEDELIKKLRNEGCAPKIGSSSEEEKDTSKTDKDIRKVKKEKKKRKKKKKQKGSSSSSDSTDSDDEAEVKVEVKQEKLDQDYDKALYNSGTSSGFRRRDDSSRSDDRYRSDQRDNSVPGSSRGRVQRSDRRGYSNHSCSDEERDNRRPDKSVIKERSTVNGSHNREGFNNRTDAGRGKKDRERSSDRDRHWERDKERDDSRNLDRDNYRNKDQRRDGGRLEDRGREWGRGREDGDTGRHRKGDRSREGDRYR